MTISPDNSSNDSGNIHAHAGVTRVREALLRDGIEDSIIVCPAAGHPNNMFQISPKQLAGITQARVADIALIK